MKTIFTILLLFIYSVTFSQEREYEKVILDGKEAYLSIKTGEIYSEKPNGVKAAIKKETKTISVTSENTATEKTYSSSILDTVKKGETLYALSRKHGVSVAEICKLNNIEPTTRLKLNQVIAIPAPDKTHFHSVQKGETLYAISKKYNTSVDQLKLLNNLTTNNLSIDQELQIK